MAGTDKAPHISEDLLKYLGEQFPNRVPRMEDSERQIWAAVGRQDVIAHLKRVHELQVKAALLPRR